MNITLKQIRYVCEVARLGSIQAAARELRISQSSILVGIDVAEQEMGAPIFMRRPAKGVQITPTGKLFVSAGRKVLDAETEFSRSLDSLAKGTPQVLRIGCGPAFGGLFLAEVLKRYVAQAGPTQIMMFEGDQSQLQQWQADGVVDVVIAYDDGVGFGDSVTPICKVPSHAVLAAGNPLASQSAVSIVELATQPFVLLDKAHSVVNFMTVFELLATRPKINFRSRSYETVRAAVAAGFGVSILNMRPIGSAMTDGKGIVRLPITDDLPPPILIVADMYGARKPRFVQLLIDVLRAFFREIGPRRFCVAPPGREATIFDV